MTVLIIFIALVVMICLNVPIAVALAISAILGLLITEGPGSLVTVALDMYDGSTKFSLIAIPMFVLAGAIMNGVDRVTRQTREAGLRVYRRAVYRPTHLAGQHQGRVMATAAPLALHHSDALCVRKRLEMPIDPFVRRVGAIA